MHQHLSILVVDDDAVDRMAVRRALKAAALPCTIEEAVDGPSALAALDRIAVNVILLDYHLPGTDGLTVLRAIRTHGYTVPVVMLTGQGDEQLAVELLRSGATDYLTKNAVSPDVLAQSIYRALRVHRAEQLAVEAEQALHVAAERQHFLAEASQYLVESLNHQTIIERLAELATRQLADAAAVDMLGEGGVLVRVATAIRQSNAQTLPTSSTADVNLEILVGTANVVRSGKPIRYSQVAAGAAGAEGELLAAYAAASVGSVLIVPLTVRNETTGAVTFKCADTNSNYTHDDLLLANDLTHRAAIALDNARLYREAQDAVRVRDAFLSVAAHELKTPLTTLFGNVQLLQRRAVRESSMNERDQRTLRIVAEQTGRLNKMIGALLDLSRLQMGQFAMQLSPVDLIALTQRVVDELQPSLDHHAVALSGDLDALVIEADELRLEQVLQNLLQNAIKYSPNGGTITVAITHAEAEVQVAVSDQGIGIPASSIPHLFGRFFRAENAQEHRISGIGVGLYVVHEIVTRHGGTIDVASVEGEGTTFTVHLPLAAQIAA
ncbi:MAG: response regulator [Roseiflexaceae bacterium]|nr:response regulator [Roseiflexaceae bacterium]